MEKNPKILNSIVSHLTVRKIRIGVIAGHFLTVVLVLSFSVISEWLDKEEDTITIQFYDPALDNVVENPSPDPDPANPIPPSGSQDGGEPTTVTEPEISNKLPRALVPEQVRALKQPEVKNRTRPKPAVNRTLPQAQKMPQARTLKQPKVKTRKNPNAARNRNKTGSSRRESNISSNGSRGPRGSNPQPGHTAPGGERGNSGYDIQVAMMIKRMWVTPDLNRLGGREPRVTIEIHIAPDGRVTYKRIKQRSGILAMDESISALLDNLHRVKAPFDGKNHTLIFSLKAENQ